MARSLIICPTFDHADTLFASVASVQAQRDQDWEMVVICDGAPQRTVDILASISATDSRISYQVHTKGERLGEAHRDPVMRESNAEFVCHIGDDDIWSNQHLSVMIGMLQKSDFALQGSLELGTAGTWAWNFANSGTALARNLSASPDSSMLVAGLNNFAVRRSAYLSLERGWTPAPSDMGSDVFMCLEYLRRSDLRIASSSRSTFAKLPSRLERKAFSPERRLAELTPVLANINSTHYLEIARAQAVIGAPVMRALTRADSGKHPTLKRALKSIGIRVIGAHAQPETAIDGALMGVPLTASQLEQCEMAWLLLRTMVEPQKVCQRLQIITGHGLAWLLTPYLETVGENDMNMSLRIADVLQSLVGQAEVACAYRIRTKIQTGKLAEAQMEIEDAMTLWPNAGWVQAMRTQHAAKKKREN